MISGLEQTFFPDKSGTKPKPIVIGLERVFPRLDWSHVFPRLALGTCFPSLGAGFGAGCMFFRLPALDNGCCYLKPLLCHCVICVIDSQIIVSQRSSTAMAMFNDEGSNDNKRVGKVSRSALTSLSRAQW